MLVSGLGMHFGKKFDKKNDKANMNGLFPNLNITKNKLIPNNKIGPREEKPYTSKGQYSARLLKDFLKNKSNDYFTKSHNASEKENKPQTFNPFPLKKEEFNLNLNDTVHFPKLPVKPEKEKINENGWDVVDKAKSAKSTLSGAWLKKSAEDDGFDLV
jgi:hypothetical protein